MCLACASGTAFSCEETSGTQDLLASELAVPGSTNGKQSFNYTQAAAQITRGNLKWNDSTSDNSLRTAGTVTWAYSASPDSGYSRLSPTMMAFVDKAIAAIEAVANIDFTRIGSGTSGDQAFSNSAQISIQADPDYGGGWASWSYYYGSSGQANILADATVSIGATADFSQDDAFGMELTLHEIAHSLGLLHPGDYNGSGAQSYANNAVYYQDTVQYSVMSYWSEENTGADFSTWIDGRFVGGGPTNLMLHDIAALQRLYGANMTTRTGDTVYGFNSNTGDSTWTLTDKYDSIIAAVWDAGGTDTLDVSGFDLPADIDLRQEAFSSFGGLKYNFSIAKGAVIENAIGGTGNDKLMGNSAANTLTGNGGNDVLYGMEGNDTLNGNGGNDSLLGGQGVDQLHGGDGDDWIYYDANDAWASNGVTGGGGFDTLVFEMVWTAIDLMAYGFEQSALLLIDSASELWKEISQFYNTGGRLVEKETVFDNGTSQVIVYDVDNVHSWSEWIRNYDAAGQLTSQSYVNNDTAPGGVNDNATTHEDNSAAISGNVLANDSGNSNVVDKIGNLSFSGSTPRVVEGDYGTLTIKADGTWSYVVDTTKAAFQTLGDGQHVTDEFGYTVKNSLGSANATIVIRIDGRNEPSPPALTADTGSVVEDSGVPATGNVLGNDGGFPLSVGKVNGAAVAAAGQTQIAGLYGTLTIAANGTWSYALNNKSDAVDGLAANEQLVDVFTYEVTNDYGVDTDTLTITINGATDGTRSMSGTSASESLTGSVNSDIIRAGNGNDTVLGRKGADQLHGESGNDTMRGGEGDDALYGGEGNDALHGEEGNDHVDVGGGKNNSAFGGEGNDTMVGGGGVDTLWGDGGDDVLDAGGGKSNALNGGEGNDTLKGGSGIDTLRGDAGDDHLDAGGGKSNALYGGEGNDTLLGGGGADNLFGEAGNDYLHAGDGKSNKLSGGEDDDTLIGGGGVDNLYGDGGNDVIEAGGGKSNTLYGGEGNDRLGGGGGADKLYGGNGNDRLFGAAGSDTLYGEAGSDILVAGIGADKLYGGADSDIFVFGGDASADTVYDYVDGFDKLSLTGTGLEFDDLVITVSKTSAVIKSSDGTLSMTIANAANLIDITDFVDAPDMIV